MKNVIRVLMWAHYIYLLSLQTLAVLSAQVMFPGTDFPQTLLIIGFPPVLMYTLFLANGYALPASLAVALIVVLAVPAQIALSVALFGGGSVWLFFAENAAVEICSFVAGTLFTAVRARVKEFGLKPLIFILAIVFLLFSGGIISYFLLVFYGYGGFSPWLVLFATSLAVAGWEYAKVYQKVVERHRKTGRPEEIVMKFESRFLSRIFRLKQDVPMISPLKNRADGRDLSGPVLVFGFTAMFLPVVVSMIVEIAL
jgi:hypothetical protein